MRHIQPKQYDVQQGAIIDVRDPDEFLREHIAGSINIPLDRIASSISQLTQYPALVLSCQSGRRAEEAFRLLEAAGIANVACLDGALNGWKACGLATVSLKSGISIMRQVQLIVGSMVLLGVFVKPLGVLAVIAGLGMLVAGLTNTCLLAAVLAKMPWNHSAASCSLDS